MAFKATPHAVMRMPTFDEMMEMGKDKWLEKVGRREELIVQEKNDMYRFGWEPPKWKLADCLLGMDWVDKKEAEEVRLALGFKKAIDVLLINGGNRGGKSQYAASRVMKTLVRNEHARVWCFHSKETMSIEYQQPVIWQYFPVEWRQKITTSTAYINFKEKTGFSDMSFVLPNHSRCTFMNYSMDLASGEGANLNMVWCDELVTKDWVDLLELRIAEKRGKMIITFTPVQGFTPTVQMFQAGAASMLDRVAWLLPRDGGEMDVGRAVGLSEEEVKEVVRASKEKVAAKAPFSRPARYGVTDILGKEDCGGRVFEKVPVVMKPPELQDPYGIRGVLFFHSSDNPFGNPLSVIEKLKGQGREKLLEKFYGVAERSQSVQFPAFDRKVHVVKADEIPKAGANYMLIDPASGRNFVMLWARRTPEKWYIYREWPGKHMVPGQGVLGAWAVPDSKKADGRKGPAQKSLGWGLVQYKREIARLEGWKPLDVKEELAKDERDRLEMGWSEKEAAEKIIDRYMDSRFANVKNIENSRPVTLLEKFSELGLTFLPTPGEHIDEGVTLISDALAWDSDRECDFFNSPSLYVSEECENTIFALENWTGADGERGACKDFIDLLRYMFLLNLEYCEASSFTCTEGGSW